MKVLIWMGSFLIAFLVSVVIDLLLMPFGIRQGWIIRTLIVVALPIFIAKKLCEMYDSKHTSKVKNKVDKEIEKSGMTKEEYIKANVPALCIEVCERCRGRRVYLESSLLPFLKDKKISKKLYMFLLEEYGEK